ncbi:MAG: CDP-alcohol phosphatidyltransferase family protein [Hominilimicola sp.]
MKNIVNMITVSRIITAAFLFFAKPLSALFYALYTICGITDMLDGTVARVTHTESKTGAILDSIADLVFCVAAVIKLFGIVVSVLPDWIYAIIVLVAAVRIAAYIIGGVKYHTLASRHTYMNKLTGAALFAVPYFFNHGIGIVCAIAAVCVVISAAEELVMNIKSDTFDPDRKSLRSVD